MKKVVSFDRPINTKIWRPDSTADVPMVTISPATYSSAESLNSQWQDSYTLMVHLWTKNGTAKGIEAFIQVATCAIWQAGVGVSDSRPYVLRVCHNVMVADGTNQITIGQLSEDNEKDYVCYSALTVKATYEFDPRTPNSELFDLEWE